MMGFVRVLGGVQADRRGMKAVCCGESRGEQLRDQVALGLAGVAAAAALMVAPMSAEAVANAKFPPIDRTNPNRCLVSSSAMGQANAARDALFDLRECDLSQQDFSGYDVAGAIMEKANFEGAIFREAVMSKIFAVGTNMKGADFTNAVVDRAIFNRANLEGAIFTNAVLSESSFKDANLENTDFTNVYIGDFALRGICKNPSLMGENPVTGNDTRESLGC